ncbi:VOC family protein [Capillimicrobium parvum]|uniref:Manganese-dependent 2,3-dihydroxybiphenyl 1,2-dioxygenase n=1 Tax=Capillimicrobium parvum TaxID=2884022 RepID=A0A9E6XVM8_9ACTN|nr:VOC family protein [Capillimicrobium parvum]UGS35300.1 Manganese-dependent 2,3-dihydroxybiphenyl 1,2-dioxygenase [Capillimicrobium parvum]
MSHRLLSHLAHVELLTTDLDASVGFAVDALGLDVVREDGDSVSLRCWGDFYSHSLVLTAADAPGLGHAAWRTDGPEQLDEAVAKIEAAGTQGEWIESSAGHGRAYRFEGPGGHANEVFWEVERAVAPAGEESPYPDRPQRTGGHGIGVRLIDHVTVTTPSVRDASAWYRDVLGFRTMAYIEPAPGAPWIFSVNTTNEKSHDLGLVADFEGRRGRHHHLAFWVETNHDLVRGASFLIEHGHAIDYGPGQHGIGEQNYLYFRDPAGLRYELNSGGYRNYVPDWEPARWGIEDGPNNSYRTEVAMPAVHMVAIPPGVAGSMETPAAAPAAAGSPEDSLSRL